MAMCMLDNLNATSLKLKEKITFMDSAKIQNFHKATEKLSVKQIKEIRRMKNVRNKFGPESQ